MAINVYINIPYRSYKLRNYPPEPFNWIFHSLGEVMISPIHCIFVGKFVRLWLCIPIKNCGLFAWINLTALSRTYFVDVFDVTYHRCETELNVTLNVGPWSLVIHNWNCQTAVSGCQIYWSILLLLFTIIQWPNSIDHCVISPWWR